MEKGAQRKPPQCESPECLRPRVEKRGMPGELNPRLHIFIVSHDDVLARFTRANSGDRVSQTFGVEILLVFEHEKLISRLKSGLGAGSSRKHVLRRYAAIHLRPFHPVGSCR